MQIYLMNNNWCHGQLQHLAYLAVSLFIWFLSPFLASHEVPRFCPILLHLALLLLPHQLLSYHWSERKELNPDKMEVMLVSRRANRDEEILPVLDGVALPLKEQVCSLGVLLDLALLLEAQVEVVARGAFAWLRLARQLRPFLEKADLATETHALVTSQLDYCDTLFVGLPLKNIWKLQLVQNAAARVLSGAAWWEHITPILKELHWLPVCFRVQFKVLVLTFNALNGLGPGYLRDHLLPRVAAHLMRSSEGALLQVPTMREVRLLCMQDRAFSVAAPRLWNALPGARCSSVFITAFRTHVKSWLFTQAFV
ncbi:uncharacterized protein LOC128322765 [Hemicordylus capensis]|uniref:uncharacterized protein LOC128322765 n=1 Tax=Hemicordylus capensis TaxID=884348 RepID=UPI00230258EE|nr:uncharacterized protein LOC128322765 [Hemicordylus capensis]XP_053100651.1 uncharacterized protein LOC128322765 [Hemicordylus capensis]XP_053100652.1 uncharacterized protein LOC128322765 [Hemicordylus capensis]XP_053100658.1 uncharacterized protein LOC128322765 [Hemicordylus capensis]